MRKIMWILIGLVIGGVLAYNGYLLMNFTSEKPSLSGAPSTTSAFTSNPIGTFVPVPSKTARKSLQPSEALKHKGLSSFILLSEANFHLHLSKTGIETLREFGVPPNSESLFALMADMAKSNGDEFLALLDSSAQFDLIVTPKREAYYSFEFDSSPDAILQNATEGGEMPVNLITVDGDTAYFGPSATEITSKIRNNEPYFKGQGAYGEAIENFTDMDTFVRFSRSFADFTTIPFHTGLLKNGTELQFYWEKGGTSTFSVKWDSGPQWVKSLSIDPRLPATPYIPEDSHFAFVVGLAPGVDKAPAAKQLWSLLFEEEPAKKAWDDFKTDLGITPSEISKYVRSRFFLFLPPDAEELSGDDTVFGFNLEKNMTVDNLLKEFGNGDIFGGKKCSTMLYKSRKIFFPDDENEQPGFSIALIDNLLLFSPKHRHIRETLKAYPNTLGILTGLDAGLGKRLANRSSVIMKITPQTWTQVFKGFPSYNSTAPVWLSYKFSLRWFHLETTLEPDSYFYEALLPLLQQ